MNTLTVGPMTAIEARQCIEDIKHGMTNIRLQLLELYEREGWRALGYDSWRGCVLVEFGQSEAKLYYELAAAKAERNISTMVEIGTTPELGLRDHHGRIGNANTGSGCRA